MKPDSSEYDFRAWQMVHDWGVDEHEIPFIQRALSNGLVVIVRERRGEWLWGQPRQPLVCASKPDNLCSNAFPALFEQ